MKNVMSIASCTSPRVSASTFPHLPRHVAGEQILAGFDQVRRAEQNLGAAGRRTRGASVHKPDARQSIRLRHVPCVGFLKQADGLALVGGIPVLEQFART